MTSSLETELRAAIAHIEHAKDEFAHATTPEFRGVIHRELTQAQLSIMRVMHLISGQNGGTSKCNGSTT